MPQFAFDDQKAKVQKRVRSATRTIAAVSSPALIKMNSIILDIEDSIDGNVKAVIPNTLTLIRFFLGPVVAVGFVYALTLPMAWLAYLIVGCYAIIALLDLLDGHLSRRWSVESDFGARWDPFADKVLVLPLLLALWFVGIVNLTLLIPAIIIGLREPGIDLLRRCCTSTSFPSSPMAKVKTAIQMISLGILMLSHETMLPGMWPVGATLFWIAATLSLLTGIDYIARLNTRLNSFVDPALVFLRVRSRD